MIIDIEELLEAQYREHLIDVSETLQDFVLGKEVSYLGFFDVPGPQKWFPCEEVVKDIHYDGTEVYINGKPAAGEIVVK